MPNRPDFSLSPKMLVFQIMAVVLAVSLNLTACTTPAPPPPASGSGAVAYTEGVPGGVMVKTMKISARVTAIDTAKRKVTLLGPDGDKVTVKVGPEAVNFDQIRVGDLVNATVTEELVVYLDEEGAPPPDGSAAMVALAPKGAQPGGLVAETTQVTATIMAIDTIARTATLQFEDGSSQTLRVRDDIDLSKHDVGERVVFQVTEMVALSVEKP
jgi:hypothetical protein